MQGCAVLAGLVTVALVLALVTGVSFAHGDTAIGVFFAVLDAAYLWYLVKIVSYGRGEGRPRRLPGSAGSDDLPRQYPK